ncbi:motile sperm domain-containing protein 1-like isoform X2 [Tachypleus tridentatus]|uniref:motile sperm domain-containing protein 1-like isoform X2 n=1 Tax=Tachypleus tridentatus TaxID=6853 RepID=UPI003FD13785
MQSTNLIDGRLPIFSFPSSLTFYASDQSSHKQILTLYNPYDFPLKFQVLCTSPKKFVVVDPEGTIRPHYCIDIVIRHSNITQNNYGVTDKFRIQVYEHGRCHILGKRDIPATLLLSKPVTSVFSSTDSEQFERLSKQSIPKARNRQYAMNEAQESSNTRPNVIVILAAVLCIMALMLPMQGDPEGQLPLYFHLSMHQKLIAAYTLGLAALQTAVPAVVRRPQKIPPVHFSHIHWSSYDYDVFFLILTCNYGNLPNLKVIWTYHSLGRMTQ